LAILGMGLRSSRCALISLVVLLPQNVTGPTQNIRPRNGQITSRPNPAAAAADAEFSDYVPERQLVGAGSRRSTQRRGAATSSSRRGRTC
jgi:hypothetical protein